MEKKDIKTHPELCAQCLRCQFACSFQHQGIFNPGLAGIDVERGKITFNEKCKPKCILCVNECAYHALERVERNDG